MIKAANLRKTAWALCAGAHTPPLPTLFLSLLLCLAGLVPAAATFAQDEAVTAAPAAVNINTADAEQLAQGLNGIGASRAEEIVRYRELYGPFKTVDELTQVSGVGLATVERNRKLITLE